MEDWLKCQISPLVKYRQNQKASSSGSRVEPSLTYSDVHTTNVCVSNNSGFLLHGDNSYQRNGAWLIQVTILI